MITNKRALITVNDGRTVTASFWPDQLKQIHILYHSDGTNSIVFGKRAVSRDDDFNLIYEDVGFLRIADHRKALRHLEKLASSQES